jgi:hypothetical protein
VTRQIGFTNHESPITSRFAVASNTQNDIPSSNALDKGVAFFLSGDIDLAHHAWFFRIFFGRTMEETQRQRSKNHAVV